MNGVKEFFWFQLFNRCPSCNSKCKTDYEGIGSYCDCGFGR